MDRLTPRQDRCVATRWQGRSSIPAIRPRRAVDVSRLLPGGRPARASPNEEMPCLPARPSTAPSTIFAQPAPHGDTRVSASRWCRPWARCTPATSRWSATPASGRTASVVSIFVNPTQFGPNEDFARYPRDEAADVGKLAALGVDAVFAPNGCRRCIRPASPPPSSSAGRPTGSRREFRPHFFEGVATVVAKLLLAVPPRHAIFGEKDYQQLMVIRRMVARPDAADRDRRPTDGARGRRPRPLLAQRLSLAGGARRRRRAFSRRCAGRRAIRIKATRPTRRSPTQPWSSPPRGSASTISRCAMPRASRRSPISVTSRCGCWRRPGSARRG